MRFTHLSKWPGFSRNFGSEISNYLSLI